MGALGSWHRSICVNLPSITLTLSANSHIFCNISEMQSYRVWSNELSSDMFGQKSSPKGVWDGPGASLADKGTKGASYAGGASWRGTSPSGSMGGALKMVV